MIVILTAYKSIKRKTAVTGVSLVGPVDSHDLHGVKKKGRFKMRGTMFNEVLSITSTNQRHLSTDQPLKRPLTVGEARRASVAPHVAPLRLAAARE